MPQVDPFYSLGPLVFKDVGVLGRYEVANIEPADLDGDGDLDLILASEENNSIIQIYENLGGGSFRNSGNALPFQSPDQRHWNFGIVVADFNVDGRPDIATADAWAGMNVYFNRGGLRFEQVQNFVFPGMGEVKGIAAADLNGDHFMDIILGDHNGDNRGDRVLLNDGKGNLIDSGQSIGWDITWEVFSIDINRDGAPDYISVNRYAQQPARVHWNDGRGFFTKTLDIPDSMDDSMDIKCFAKGDYTYCFIANTEDRRGRFNRYLVFDKTGELVVNKGFGELNASTSSMCLADLNLDGEIELVVGNYNGNSLAFSFKQDGRGILDFASSIPLFAIPTTASIACGDLNGDGRMDLIVGQQDIKNAIREYHLLLQQEPRLSASTDAPSNLTTSSVALNGTVNPHGLATTARFEWGTSPSYSNLTPPQLVGSGADRIGIQAVLTGLAPGTQYHYRVIASSSVGTISGVDASFMTPPGTPTLSLALSAGAAASASTIGLAGALQTGYATAKLSSGVAPYGTAVFSFRQKDVVVSEAAVPASPPTTSARIFIDHRSGVAAIPGRMNAGTIEINTGIAVVNPGFVSANVTYTLRNAAGSVLAVGHGTVDAGRHFACFIDQLKGMAAPDFNLPSNFQNAVQFGTLSLTSDQPLSVLALRGITNQRNDFLITSTPIADLTRPLAGSPVYFPQFVDGGGYTTSLILTNTSGETETGVFQIMDNDGTPFVVRQAGITADSSFRYSIPPNGVFRFQTDGSPAGVKAGWLRLIADAGTSAPVGSAVFGYNPSNILVSESGIPSAAGTTHARVFVDLSGSHNTGLAIANLADRNADIAINVFQNDGITRIGTSQGPVQLPANGHKAFFADGIINGLPAGFTGVLEISSSTRFAALTMRSLMNERGDFLLATFPIADMNVEAPSPIVFPHVVEGGGYMTQFIFIGAGGASSLTLHFFGEDGRPLAVGKSEIPRSNP